MGDGHIQNVKRAEDEDSIHYVTVEMDCVESTVHKCVQLAACQSDLTQLDINLSKETDSNVKTHSRMITEVKTRRNLLREVRHS